MDVVLAIGIAATVTLLGYFSAGFVRTTLARHRASVAAVADEGLADLFVFVDPRHLLLLHAIALTLATGVAIACGAGAPILVATVAVAAVAPRVAHRWLRARRERRLAHQLPDALAALAGALRAGLSLTQALGTLADQQPKPIALEFRLILRKQRLGMTLDQAIVELGARVDRQEYALFVASMRVARELGGNLAESLERLADTLRRKLGMEDRIVALTAQGRLQGWIVGALPLFIMWVLTWLEPAAMHRLYTTPQGWAVLAVIAILLAVGGLLIRRIVRIDV